MRHLTLPRAARGLTLVELMVALAIAALLAVAAVPSLGEYIANARLRESGHSLYLQTLLAQSEAIKRNTVVRIALADDRITVSDQTDPMTPITLRELPLIDGITGDAFALDFGGEGRPLAFASASVNLRHARQPCSDLIRCPGLRVDGGGGVRLCVNHTAC